jgi:UDP-N-acetylmuramoyl-L-alanyl-D-glutamate--2,6-diaminopimelate ligase
MPNEFKKIELGFPPHLKGGFNIENLKAAKSILMALGLSEDTIITHLSQSYPPPGRFESINLGQPFSVIIDFAHTPDALENILSEARKMAENEGAKVITLFGCGGNRDKTKRPLMAAIAQKFSDHIVITSDNPRDEAPSQIIAEIVSGLTSSDNVTTIEDRKIAIQYAISIAAPKDIVIIAGKGHEQYQIIGQNTFPFSDQEVTIKAIKSQIEKV